MSFPSLDLYRFLFRYVSGGGAMAGDLQTQNPARLSGGRANIPHKAYVVHTKFGFVLHAGILRQVFSVFKPLDQFAIAGTGRFVDQYRER
jgi:hypothetical protein